MMSWRKLLDIIFSGGRKPSFPQKSENLLWYLCIPAIFAHTYASVLMFMGQYWQIKVFSCSHEYYFGCYFGYCLKCTVLHVLYMFYLTNLFLNSHVVVWISWLILLWKKKMNKQTTSSSQVRLARWYFGGLAGSLAACCTHPLDLLKVGLLLLVPSIPFASTCPFFFYSWRYSGEQHEPCSLLQICSNFNCGRAVTSCKGKLRKLCKVSWWKLF